ncbi:serine-rich coiled-coil domain-containing protein 1 [Ambystoma mexicanum]|uniref:serine-rich coiled-coil domain-containing protein 1 n=1 Tax=Ambystoma mexicanum TaxID=8296 RepID=UPI0037E823C9
MGDAGSRRSTLVSRLPIFRRSISRRQDSLPSSPLSCTVGGIQSSSPSSTNSSADSAGKRRSIFRTPSLNFHHKKESERKDDPTPLISSIPNGVQTTEATRQTSTSEQHVKTKGRHSLGFTSSCSKKLSRSATEDFDKRKEHSSNRNVFTNCISSGNDGDDSGYVEDQSQRSVKRSSRKLLPKSFSSHHRFSKSTTQSLAVCSDQQSRSHPQIQECADSEPAVAKCTLPCSAETTECATSSLPSPLPSTDHTTAPQTPSESLLFIDDSISETEVLPNSGSTTMHIEEFGHNVSTSQILLNPAAAATHLKKTEPSTNTSPRHASENLSCEHLSTRRDYTKTLPSYPGKVLLPISELPASDGSSIGDGIPTDTPTEDDTSNIGDTIVGYVPAESCELQNGAHFEMPDNSPKNHTFLEDHKLLTIVEQVMKPHVLLDSKINSLSSETQQPVDHHGHHSRVNYASSLSPFREGRYFERRLRSSSEGTSGSSRLALKPKEGNSDDQNSLPRQRTSSTSSKMNSLDVLNNLGSCELDEDDLMLDLEFLEDKHRHRSVCREDSFQSIVSCSSIVFSSIEQQPADSRKNDEELRLAALAKKNFSLNLSKDMDQGEYKCPRVSQMASSPSVDWPFASLEESVGLEALPFRLMMQDCTSVKTLLLKMKRILQESTDMSPGSSNTSLPISPIAECPFPFKDIMRDEAALLKLQLKERDELICQLREELEKVQHAQRPSARQLDKSTQTELIGHDALWNSASTEGSIYKAIRPVRCFQHYQINTNIWTQDAFH